VTQLQEATEAIKPILKEYYLSDDRNVYKALWEDFPHTGRVTPEKPGSGVLWFFD
jgi:hypothetical protein